eukprot:scaffold1754_cov355-Prasinococcus_capsulatus_cf.AAC.7
MEKELRVRQRVLDVHGESRAARACRRRVVVVAAAAAAVARPIGYGSNRGRSRAWRRRACAHVRVRVRARVLVWVASSFNKNEEDFDTLDEWNDYLEETEDISTWRQPQHHRPQLRGPAAAPAHANAPPRVLFVGRCGAVYNLANDIEVAQTEQKLAAYYKANQEDIAMRNARRVRAATARLLSRADAHPGRR